MAASSMVTTSSKIPKCNILLVIAVGDDSVLVLLLFSLVLDGGLLHGHDFFFVLFHLHHRRLLGRVFDEEGGEGFLPVGGGLGVVGVPPSVLAGWGAWARPTGPGDGPAGCGGAPTAPQGLPRRLAGHGAGRPAVTLRPHHPACGRVCNS